MTDASDLAREGRTAELIELIDRGLSVNSVDAEGNSLLLLAAYRGQTETLQALIRKGADVNLRNSGNQSAIAGAIFKGEDQIVRALVAAGADLDSGTPSARVAAQMFGRGHLLVQV